MRQKTICKTIKKIIIMSQKFIKKKQTSPKSLGYGKFYAKAVYNQKHITTRQLADFIQTQASVKRSDCIAVLDELGFALRHFIGLGEKVKIENVGIFKCGLRNKRGGFEDAKDLTASSLSPRILFQPEYTTSTQNGVTRAAVAMLGDITFEEATDYEAPKVASSNQGGGTNQGGSNTGGNNGGGGDNLGQN